jgi:hypothetical protein
VNKHKQIPIGFGIYRNYLNFGITSFVFLLIIRKFVTNKSGFFHQLNFRVDIIRNSLLRSKIASISIYRNLQNHHLSFHSCREKNIFKDYGESLRTVPSRINIMLSEISKARETRKKKNSIKFS